MINYDESSVTRIPLDELRYSKLLYARRFAEDTFERLNGSEVTIEWAATTGFRDPVVIPVADGLGMVMPPATLTVRDVARACGCDRELDAVEVSTQTARKMTLEAWANYFEEDPIKRTKILNVISLEISDTDFGRMIKRPKVVEKLDWTDQIWPFKLSDAEYPKVQKYCLMSVKECYTDFHIDFAGSSVFYHVLSGAKAFYLIEPTPVNLKKI